MYHYFRRRGLSALLACVCAAPAWAESAIYAYLDADGAVNLSNVPDDQRYQLLVGQEIVSAPSSVEESIKLRSARSPDPWGRYSHLVIQTAKHYRVDAALVRAVIRAESGYNPNAVSHRGAGGLMQLMPATARRFGVVNVFDPSQNIRGGVRYLVELLELFDNDLRLALAAYNAGEASVLKYGKRVPPYRETTEYVARVEAFYRLYRQSM